MTIVEVLGLLSNPTQEMVDKLFLECEFLDRINAKGYDQQMKKLKYQWVQSFEDWLENTYGNPCPRGQTIPLEGIYRGFQLRGIKKFGAFHGEFAVEFRQSASDFLDSSIKIEDAITLSSAIGFEYDFNSILDLRQSFLDTQKRVNAEMFAESNNY